MQIHMKSLVFCLESSLSQRLELAGIVQKWKSKIRGDFKSQYSQKEMNPENGGKSRFSLKHILKNLPYKLIWLFLICLAAASYYVVLLLKEVIEFAQLDM